MRFAKIVINLRKVYLVGALRTGWARGLELVGDDERCVALAGLLPVRRLAERAGLTAGLTAAMHRPGYDPDYDRGQVRVDLGLVQLAGGQTIGDFQALAHLEKLIGPVPSTPTAWRSLDEADGPATRKRQTGLRKSNSVHHSPQLRKIADHRSLGLSLGTMVAVRPSYADAIR